MIERKDGYGKYANGNQYRLYIKNGQLNITKDAVLDKDAPQ